MERTFKRLLPNPNIQILGKTSVRRQHIISFLFHTTSCDQSENGNAGSNIWREKGARDKPLHGRLAAKLLNDLFGIQARGGCACAGPYGHILLGINNEKSLQFCSMIAKGYEGLKPGWTRLSFAYDMSAIEFEFILAAIEFLAVHGQRFLPLYRFNWKTGDWKVKRSEKKKIVGEDLMVALSNSGMEGVLTIESSGNLPEEGGALEFKYTKYLEAARNIARSPEYQKELLMNLSTLEYDSQC